MKTRLLIVLAVVVLGAGSALAVMNNACKSSHHAWQLLDIRTMQLGAARPATVNWAWPSRGRLAQWQ